MNEHAHSPETPTDRRNMLASAAALGLGGLAATSYAQGAEEPEPSELAVLWTSADPDVAHRVGLMYTHAAKSSGWFERVRLIAWGPSQRTLVGDKDLRAKVKQMQADGVTLQACVVCAGTFGIAEELREIGFEVIPMGGPLTKFMKDPSVSVLSI